MDLSEMRQLWENGFQWHQHSNDYNCCKGSMKVLLGKEISSRPWWLVSFPPFNIRMDRALIHTLVPADKIVEPLFEGISTWDEHLTEFSAGGHSNGPWQWSGLNNEKDRKAWEFDEAPQFRVAVT